MKMKILGEETLRAALQHVEKSGDLEI